MEGWWIGLNDYLPGFLDYPSLTEAFVDILVCAVPIWAAVMIGLLIGWSWRPRWAGLVFLGFRSKLRFAWTLPPGLGARRFWFAFTALSAFSLCRGIWFRSRRSTRKLEKSAAAAAQEVVGSPAGDAQESVAVDGDCIGPITSDSVGEPNSVSDKDLEYLLHFLDGKDGEMAWQSMMERSTSNMSYQAWQHEPEMGPIVFRSKTIFEDATPEQVRDFFWDDEFRPKWDPMLVHVKILEESLETGMMIIHWIKKFPFFCSDREYIIGRRIWEGANTYYCVTKGVPYPTLPRRDKPRRVDRYFSSWVIKPAQSRRGDGQLSACEVTLVHHEDMGIPKDVAKLGVRHGMWGTVKKLHSGFRAYQTTQNSEVQISRCALNARISTRVLFDDSAGSREQVASEEERRNELAVANERKSGGGIDWKWMAVGGAVAVACGLQTGLIGRALIIGVGHRIARRRGNR